MLPLPAPAEQTQGAEAGGEEWEGGGKRGGSEISEGEGNPAMLIFEEISNSTVPIASADGPVVIERDGTD